MAVKGKIMPLGDKVMVTGMEFGMTKTSSGLFIPSTDGKTTGIHPRWGKVYAIGPDQTDVEVGQWILIEHGRWTRAIKVVEEDGREIKIQMIDNDAIMVISDEQPATGDIIA